MSSTKNQYEMQNPLTQFPSRNFRNKPSRRRGPSMHCSPRQTTASRATRALVVCRAARHWSPAQTPASGAPPPLLSHAKVPISCSIICLKKNRTQPRWCN